MRISVVCLQTLLFSCAVAGAAIASPYPQVSSATAENQLRCFMHMPTGSSLNLESICNYVPVVVAAPSGGGGGSTSSGSVSSGGGGGGGSSSGSCNNPSDTASDGSRCGGRAASARPGGR